MLDILMEILEFLVENPWLFLGLGVAVFVGLAILESHRVKYYGEPSTFWAREIEKIWKDTWKKEPPYADHSCSHFESPRDTTRPSYVVRFGGNDWTSQNIGHIYKNFKMDYRNKGVVKFERKGIEKVDLVCFERIS